LEYMRTCQPRRESPRLAEVADIAMGNMWSEIGETVVSYIFVHYFCWPYKRVDFIRLLLISLRAYGSATKRGLT
jgi:hypothetical protein